MSPRLNKAEMASYTDTQLQALMDALARGERRVRFADREVEYRTLDELVRAIAILKAANSPTPRYSFTGFNRG